eukprot:gene28754-31936_t
MANAAPPSQCTTPAQHDGSGVQPQPFKMFALGGNQSLYNGLPSTRLQGAVTKLQYVCREIPNGKRCAPIPVHYTFSAKSQASSQSSGDFC